MTCWDNCGYTWRAVGESTSCTRDINNGIVVNTRLTTEILSIHFDSDGTEPYDHIFTAIIKIYELYDGDASETLVYENVDTFYYGSAKVYYKYVEWEVVFNNASESPLEVRIATRHKDLCPGCSHPYVCDCEEAILVGHTTTTIAPDADLNPEAETMVVELLNIASNWLSVNANVKIYRNGLLKYNNNHIIPVNDYVDINDSILTHIWRVNCTNITPIRATFQLCHNFFDSGEGSGSTGAGLLVAQYFDSTTFGWTGGCTILCEIENPRSGGGDNTAPTLVELNLYEWQGDYTDTIHSTSLTTCTMLTPSEELEDSYFYIPFIWDIDISPGEYMWTLKCLYGPHDGSFNVLYQAYTEYCIFPCWRNGFPHNSANSRILGITPEESWEGVLCVDDLFYSGGYQGYGGHSDIKINSGAGYKNMLSSKTGCNCVKVGVGTPNIPTGRITDNSSDIKLV